MRLLADRHIFLIDRLNLNGITLEYFDSLEGLPGRTTADALLVRTVTPVTGTWLRSNPSVRFVGTASAGFDHLDTAAMDHLGICWASSPGCNSQSVAEWVVAALVLAGGRSLLTQHLTVGIAGVGNAGSAVERMCKRLGWDVIVHDPPRTVREPGFFSAPPEAFAQADVVTVHVPLSSETRNMLGPRFWPGRRKFAVINAARGGILQEPAALKAREKGQIEHLLLDVWAGEPDFSIQTAGAATVHTPHVAGYSYRAKINATRYVSETLLAYFHHTEVPDWPRPVYGRVESVNLPDAIHPVRAVHDAFRAMFALHGAEKAKAFHALRQTQNDRVEWGLLDSPDEALSGLLTQLSGPAVS